VLGGLQVAHTADLDAQVLDVARELVRDAFVDGFTDDDWEHALGGVHALVWEDGVPVAHGSVVMRRLLHGGRALRAGYVEGVGVRADNRRRGHGATVMRALGRVVEAAYDLGALGATDQGVPLYTRLGWRRWEGRLSALTPSGIVHTPDEEGGVYVLGLPEVTGELTCDWRDGDLW
jgi:aminoglycoside 2'-N-acetyltransferase I